ncbi:MAG: hypothetical protein D3916_09825 [Candidatus Electrothrix sp. MAN1_4]|nr:hypothetical protein [Candidatus Electrothrix sp. MAN1_4]
MGRVVLTSFFRKREVKFEFKMDEQKADKDMFKKTAGLLKCKKIDPLKFQADQRAEWDGKLTRTATGCSEPSDPDNLQQQKNHEEY